MFDINVPRELIAQRPLEERDSCRFMVLDRRSGQIRHKAFKDLPDFLKAGDVIVLNVSKVVPAKLTGRKGTGGKVETLFLERAGNGTWKVLLKEFFSPGTQVCYPGELIGTVTGRNSDGEYLMKTTGASVESVLNEFGVMPLPPYIKRNPIIHPNPPLRKEGVVVKPLLEGNKNEATGQYVDTAAHDKAWYQTIYARDEGSIAAPTAGLHFTVDLLNRLRANGIEVVEVVLHVGWGTFRKIYQGNVANHKMLPEQCVISKEAANKINKARASGYRAVIVGTTCVRAVESASREDGIVEPYSDYARIFVRPGYRFKAVDVLITNFHLTDSTPFYLTCAFAGADFIKQAYTEAIKEKYRFYSYGDAMLIL